MWPHCSATASGPNSAGALPAAAARDRDNAGSTVTRRGSERSRTAWMSAAVSSGAPRARRVPSGREQSHLLHQHTNRGAAPPGGGFRVDTADVDGDGDEDLMGDTGRSDLFDDGQVGLVPALSASSAHRASPGASDRRHHPERSSRATSPG
jgi:hypothetical protein